MDIPGMVKVKRIFNDEHIADVEEAVRDQILGLRLDIRKNSEIAVAVGSRGINNIDRIVASAVGCLKELGANPFIVPAMGSHGGATAKGQKEVLERYGITEERTGAPIRSSMQVAELPRDGLENRVYMDRNAFGAAGTVVINRVKVHTDFHGLHESGLMKMCVIGLGKHRQALEIHKYGVFGLRELMPKTARQVLRHGNIIAGIGVVENAYDRTMVIKAVRPADLEREDSRLLDICRANMPGLPVQKLEVLVVDWFGKNISGTGIDTNIIGRMRIRSEKEPETPDIKNIVIADITEASHGNATGIGLGDFITRRLFEKIDFRYTYENVITSTFLERGKIPIIADTDRQALEYALRTCGTDATGRAGIIRIRDTLHLEEMYVSPAVLDEIGDREDIEVIGEFGQILGPSGEFTQF